MSEFKVKDAMVALDDYATVSEDATLYEAVLALEEAQHTFSRSEYQHRAILVFNKTGQIVGKVSQLDVVRSLEPNHQKAGELDAVGRFGFSAVFVKSLQEEYGHWQKPFDDICRKSASIKVKDIMHAPTEGEFVDQEAPLDAAIHQLVKGHHQSLLVTRGDQVVGILRLSDVFNEVCKTIKDCGS